MPNDISVIGVRSEPQLAIVPFVPAHAPRLEAIRAEAFAPVFASFRTLLGASVASVALANGEAEQRTLLESLCAAQADTQVLVAMRGDLAIGFICTKLDRAHGVGEIVLDAVAPHEAGRGVGTALMERALAYMRAEGMRVAVVGVGGDDSHAPARRAYAKAGFRAGIPSLHLYQTLD
jgi:GNAT superfamily N-acetyltransferase